MEILPAIDLMKGKVVRLSRGKPHTAKTYDFFGEPLDVARRWVGEGAKYLHVVDLDAALGMGDNRQTISEIIRGVKTPVQVGGGIRTRFLAEKMLKTGAKRIIVSTLAFQKEGVLRKLIEKYGPNRIMVALDYLDNMVMIKGWKDSAEITLQKAIDKFMDLGVKLFLLTSISRDGLLVGPDYTTLKSLVKRFNQGLFVAGGVSKLEDLARLKNIKVDGVIVGKALYEGRFNLRAAIDIVEKKQ